MKFLRLNFTINDRLDFSRNAYGAVTYFLVVFLVCMAGLFGTVLVKFSLGMPPVMPTSDLQVMATITGGVMAWAQGVYMWRRKQQNGGDT